MPVTLWHLAMPFAATVINTGKGDEDSPWRKRFGSEFPANVYPFGASVRYRPPGDRGESETVHKELPNEKAMIFAGYFFQPGGEWRGSYKIIREDDLVAYLRGELHELSIVETRDVRFPEDVEFPLLDAALKVRLEKLGGALKSTSLTLPSEDRLPPLPQGEPAGEASVPQQTPEAEAGTTRG